MSERFHLNRLPSGARLLVVPMAGTQAVTILISVRVGSRNERKSESGLSHFLEHLFFKGSEKHPSALDLTSAIESLGAEFNAWTGKEVTEYYIKVAHERFFEAFEILSDLFVRPRFPAAEFAKEKAVILQEIAKYEDQPELKVEELMEEELFPTHSLGWGIAGRRETVEQFTKADLDLYHRRFYQAPQTLITVAGRVRSMGRIRTVVRSELASLPMAERVTVKPPKPITRTRLRLVVKPVEQAHLSLGWPGLSISDPRRGTLRLLSVILGGTMSSRLFQELREVRGLCYYIRSFAQTYSDTGYFQIHAGLDHRRLSEALRAIREVVERLKQGPSEAELRRAKTYLTGRLKLRLEESDEVADFYATQVLLMKTVQTPAKLEEEINRVTAADVRKLSQELFQFSRSALAIITPHDEPKLGEILRA